MNKPYMLLIMDGFGKRDETKGNAIAAARTPHIDRLFQNYPFIKLEASGEAVGLPQGQMGNSEVGHLNIGAGRVVYQNLLRISNSFASSEINKNQAIQEAFSNAKGKTLHLMGLLSDGGVHSHIEHLLGLIKAASEFGVTKILVHCFLDGRDVPPSSAMTYLSKLENFIKDYKNVKIGVIAGRYYAMDRDKRWERLSLAYDALTQGKGEHAKTPEEAIKISYERGETDEFVKPFIINDCPISDGDSVIFYNFRPDRAREITRALVDPDFDGFTRERIPMNLKYVCMTEYDHSMPNVLVAFPPEVYPNTLGEVISKQGLKQLRIAETEKYAHVTFFINGGVEETYQGENRILVDSPKVETYDSVPEMSALKVSEQVIQSIQSDEYDFIILNFANPDMVGHTGNFDATVKAIETIDALVGEICETILDKDGLVVLTADHGNADYMLDESGNPVTKHSTSLVPLCLISNEKHPFKVQSGKLCDIAPTILRLMGISIPSEMTGQALTD